MKLNSIDKKLNVVQKSINSIIILVLILPFMTSPAARAADPEPRKEPFTIPFPRLGMWWPDTKKQSLAKIARYDWVILGEWDKEVIPELRTLNPDIVLLNSTNACELSFDPNPDYPEANLDVKNIPAEWFLTQVGTTLSSDVDATTTTFKVSAVTTTDGSQTYNLFIPGDTAVIGSESVYIKAVNKKTRTLTVRRGYVRPASPHPAGTRIAAHITFWPNSWLLNLSTLSPKATLDPAYGPETWAEYNARRAAALVADSDWDGLLVDRSDPDESWLIGNSTARTIDPDQSNNLLTDYSTFDDTWNTGLRNFESLLRNAIGPNKIIFANWGMPNYDLLNGNNFEGFPAKNGGYYDQYWKKMVFGPEQNGSYFEWMQNALQPNLTMIETYQDDGGPSATGNGNYNNRCARRNFKPNYRKMRYGLTTALLNDGFFSYEMNTNGHGSLCLMWFDEYDNAGKGRGYLGQPLGPAFQALAPLTTPNLVQGGEMDTQSDLDKWDLWTEDGYTATATIDPGAAASGNASARIDITQAQGTDWMASLAYSPIRLAVHKDYTLTFWAKADRQRTLNVWIQQQRSPWKNWLDYGEFNLTTDWQQFEIGASSSGRDRTAGLTFGLGSSEGTVWLDDISLQQGSREVYRRDFEGGVVLINTTSSSQKIDLGETFRKIRGRQQPRINNGKLISKVTIPPKDGLILLRENP